MTEKSGKKRKRTRTNRRSPWFKLERLVGNDAVVQEVSDHEFHVREDVEGLLVVQTPRELSKHPQHLVRVQKALVEALKNAGIDLPLLMIPDDIAFARFRELPPREAKELERQCSQPGFRAKNITVDTPTEGSA